MDPSSSCRSFDQTVHRSFPTRAVILVPSLQLSAIGVPLLDRHGNQQSAAMAVPVIAGREVHDHFQNRWSNPRKRSFRVGEKDSGRGAFISVREVGSGVAGRHQEESHLGLKEEIRRMSQSMDERMSVAGDDKQYCESPPSGFTQY